jgi:hypothetical protein
MNAREINSSSWPLRYYFMVALPLAVVTVAVPLYFIKVTAFLARKMQESSNTIRFLGQLLLGLSFGVSIASDVMTATGKANEAMDAMLRICFTLFFSFFCRPDNGGSSLVLQEKPNITTCLRHLWKRRSAMIIFFLTISFYMSYFFQAFIEIPFYLIYFLHLYLAGRKGKEVSKTV